MPYTEFCCRSGGSNLNAGTRTGNSTEPGTSANFTYASGNWVASTGVFTVASGNPSTDGVAVGDFASVYANGSTTTGFVGRVTAVSSTTITVSLTVKIGTAPTDGTGNRTLKIGGAWQGPNGSDGFPFTLASNSLINTSSDPARYNFKDDAQYNITSTITHPVTYVGEIVLQGYTSTYGDGGVAVIDGGTSGASYILFTVSGSRWFRMSDFYFKNNGATGSANGVVITGVLATLTGIAVSNVRGNGLVAGAGMRLMKCEFFECNASNTASSGGVNTSSSVNLVMINCTSHHNTGSGVVLDNGSYLTAVDCIFSDQTYGISNSSNAGAMLVTNCDFYNNTYGIYLTNTGYGPVEIVNSNFVKNTTNDCQRTNISRFVWRMTKCGFGSGTMASSGGVSANCNAEQIGSVTYASGVTPWVDPANGDFRINLAAAKNTGSGAFLQKKSGWTGTVAYPDIGAAQSQGGSGGGGLILPRPMNGGYSA